MTKVALPLTIAMSLALAGAARAADDARPADSDGQMRAAISVSGQSYALGQKLLVSFSVTNVSKNQSALWSRSCSWGHKVYSFVLTMPDGSTQTVDEPPMEWRRNAMSVTALEPGKSFSVELDLNTMSCGPLPVGRYKIAGVYTSEDDKTRDKKDPLWTGRLQTKETTFSIEHNALAKDLPADAPPRVAAVYNLGDRLRDDSTFMLACGKDYKVKDGQLIWLAVPPRTGQKEGPCVGALRVTKAYAGMCAAEIDRGAWLDIIEPGDIALSKPPEGLKFEKSATPPTATTAPFRYGPAEFVLVLEENNAILRLDRLNSRGANDKTATLWTKRFSSVPQTMKVQDGKVTLTNQDRVYVFDAISGRQLVNREPPAGKN